MLTAILAAYRRWRALPPKAAGLMTPEDVAARIGVEVSVIRRGIARGDIPSVRVGGMLRVERQALERTIAIIAAAYGPPP